MKIVPHSFYLNPDIEKIIMDGNSCILYKRVTETNTHKERYLSANALTLVLNGTLQVEDETEHITLIKRNHLILLPKGIYAITDLIPDDRPFEALVFFFDDYIVDEFLTHFEKYDTKEPQTTFVLPYSNDLRLYTDTLLALYRGKHMHQFTRPKLLEFLHLIHISEQGDAFINHLGRIKNRSRKSIKEFMLDNYTKPLDIADYAYLTGRSISTFQRDFKSKFNTSPRQWLIEKRMMKAVKLLEDTSHSVTEIAFMTGYENISHFIKAFSKKHGNSPKQYQINHRKNTLL